MGDKDKKQPAAADAKAAHAGTPEEKKLAGAKQNTWYNHNVNVAPMPHEEHSSQPDWHIPNAHPGSHAQKAHPAGHAPAAHPGGHTPAAHPGSQAPAAHPAGHAPAAHSGGHGSSAHPGGHTPAAHPAAHAPAAHPGAKSAAKSGALFPKDNIIGKRPIVHNITIGEIIGMQSSVCHGGNKQDDLRILQECMNNALKSMHQQVKQVKGAPHSTEKKLSPEEVDKIKKYIESLPQAAPVKASGGGNTTFKAGEHKVAGHNTDRYVVYDKKEMRVGTRAFRNNNPGNFRPYTTKKGEVKVQTGGLGVNDGFTVFTDQATGFDVMVRNLKGKSYKDLTLFQAISKYAPKSDHNDPEAYTKTVSTATGVSSSTVLKDLTDAQLNSVAKAMVGVEGFNNKGNKVYYYGQQGNPAWVDEIFKQDPPANATATPPAAAQKTADGSKLKEKTINSSENNVKDKKTDATATNKTSKVKIPDNIAIGSGAHKDAITQHTIDVLDKLMQQTGNKGITITSTQRSPAEQARVMYENIIKKNGVEDNLKLYGNGGKQVVRYAAKLIKEGKSKDEIVSGMTKLINDIGPSHVSRHTGDPNVLNVIDISPSSLRNEKQFMQAARLLGITVIRDKAVHLEIPQPQ